MELEELLKTKRTYRRFDQSKRIPDEVIDKILKSQQYASRSGNRQTLHFIAVKNPELVEKIFAITRWAASLPPEQGMPKEGEHPTFFIVVLDEEKQRNNWSLIDAGIAMDYMTLTAWKYGVGSCMIGNVHHDKLREMLSIPDRYLIDCVVAFGYPTHISAIKEIEMGENRNYHLDESGNYIVPRYKVSEVVDII